MTDRTSIWVGMAKLPSVTMVRWDGKGFTSIEIVGDDRESIGIYVASRLKELDLGLVRVIHRAGFVTPTMHQAPAFIIDAYGKKRELESEIVNACLQWKKEKFPDG